MHLATEETENNLTTWTCFKPPNIPPKKSLLTTKSHCFLLKTNK